MEISHMDVLVLHLIAQIRSMCHRPLASLIRENKSFTISPSKSSKEDRKSDLLHFLDP